MKLRVRCAQIECGDGAGRIHRGWQMKLLQRLLFASAAVILGYCAFVLGDAWTLERRAEQRLEPSLSAEPVPAALIAPDGLIGRIQIPRLGLSAVVFEGADGATLRRSVGHVPYTALPGQPGNIGLAGHRDSFFRPLAGVRRDDTIVVSTLRGDYRYRVLSTRVVKPSEVSVLHPTESEILTLVTCYPFNFIGSAPKRFIVRAERIPPNPAASASVPGA